MFRVGRDLAELRSGCQRACARIVPCHMGENTQQDTEEQLRSQPVRLHKASPLHAPLIWAVGVWHSTFGPGVGRSAALYERGDEGLANTVTHSRRRRHTRALLRSLQPHKRTSRHCCTCRHASKPHPRWGAMRTCLKAGNASRLRHPAARPATRPGRWRASRSKLGGPNAQSLHRAAPARSAAALVVVRRHAGSHAGSMGGTGRQARNCAR